MQNVLTRVLCLAGMLWCGGCGGADRPPLYSVTGIITYDGKPLANASVLLVPDGGTVAVGQTDEAGHFSLRTQGADGAVEGPAKIAVTAVESAKKVSVEEFEKMTDAERAKMSKSRIPIKYGNPQTSELTATITADAENELQIDLSK